MLHIRDVPHSQEAASLRTYRALRRARLYLSRHVRSGRGDTFFSINENIFFAHGLTGAISELACDDPSIDRCDIRNAYRRTRMILATEQASARRPAKDCSACCTEHVVRAGHPRPVYRQRPWLLPPLPHHREHPARSLRQRSQRHQHQARLSPPSIATPARPTSTAVPRTYTLPCHGFARTPRNGRRAA